jgi:hypothetical protein
VVTGRNGKAMIYVVQRATGTFKFGADGKWLGALKGEKYFHAMVDPGEHHLCVKGQLFLWKGLSLHQLNANQARPTISLFMWSLEGVTTS